ncbi:universal stress protein [Pontibaca methylaminivorans]|uniref:Nucleotide-binding universal stress protein, UspA family n=1 Tax=Pontibaca methylaminivorans TaxID=515897 RepID=A0A1R3X0Y4_9RHOB|nr:universal stress protein [Pontibaca methylaminivorans]SIT84305.1 Nucleotide-binding universal stress protein, UspA family [Pontibaca methylaminivorans]
MAYRSLLTILTDRTIARRTLEHAIALSKTLDAHLNALCLGVDRTQTSYFYEGANAIIIQESLAQARTELVENAGFARGLLERSEIRWSMDEQLTQIADLNRQVAQKARFCDLVLLPRPYGEDRGGELEVAVEAAMFEGDAPVLVVPDQGAFPPVPERIMVAWNESAEAMTAIRRALPFLKAAQTVHIAIIGPPERRIERSEPGSMLGQMLARHGVNCTIDVLGKTRPQVSDILNRHAMDTGAEMIVMGAYGHSRFREAILGGATRNMLEAAQVPVFMAR